MSLIKCNKCGEMYSDSYRTCPFCEEDETFYKGTLKRGRKRGEGGSKAPNIVGPVLILVVILVLGLLVWHFFGDKIFPGRAQQEENVTPPVEETTQQGTEIVEPTDPLEMDKTMQLVLGESKTLSVSGGTEYDWISSDPAVATVNADGEVTAISEGTAIITVTDAGGGSAVCSVTVVAEAIGENDNTGESGNSGESGSSGATGTTGVESKVDLSGVTLKSEYGTTIKPTSPGEFDISMRSGEAFKLLLEGTTATVTWSTGNAGVATMADDGTLKAVGRGSTTITGTLGSSTVHILVRVS